LSLVVAVVVNSIRKGQVTTIKGQGRREGEVTDFHGKRYDS